MFKRYLKKLTKENILFFLKEALIFQGKFDSFLYNTILKCANRSIQPHLKTVWRRVRTYRLLDHLLCIVYGILFYFLNNSLINKNLDQFILFLFIKLLLNAITSGYSNHIQDTLLTIESTFSDTLFKYQTKFNRNYPNTSKETLKRTIFNIINCERFQPIVFILMIESAILIYLFVNNNIPISPSIVMLYIVLMIVLVYIIAQQMAFYLYKFNQINDELNKCNKIQINSFDKLNANTIIKPSKPLVNKMSIVKSFANTQYLIISLLFLSTYSFINKGQNISIFIVIISFVDPIMNLIFIWLRFWPDVLISKRRVLHPIAKLLNSAIPTPISQPSHTTFKSLNIDNIAINNLKHYFPDSPNPVLEFPKLIINTTNGIYTVTGDSGQGKSVFLNILGNEIFPTEGTISIITDNSVINYNDIGYWNLRDTIRYVWVSNVEITGTNAVKLFRTYLDPKHKESYFNKLVSQSDIKGTLNKLLTNEEIIDFVNNPLIEATTSDQILIDKIVKDTLIELLFKSQLFRENESHILDLDISKLSGGQHARLITAFYLVSQLKIVLLDESLERTTKDSSHTLSFRTDSRGIYTRERMIKFIGDISKVNNQTVLLLVQGGKEEIEMIKKASGNCYLGNIVIGNKKASIIN